MNGTGFERTMKHRPVAASQEDAEDTPAGCSRHSRAHERLLRLLLVYAQLSLLSVRLLPPLLRLLLAAARR